MARLGLDQHRDQLARSLSGGWKQRLALAACVLPEPQLLLLDEPTAGVDPTARREFWSESTHCRGRSTVLVSTHYMDEAERCHEISYMADGALVVQGTVDAVVSGSALITLAVSGNSWQRLRLNSAVLPASASSRHSVPTSMFADTTQDARGSARRAQRRPAAGVEAGRDFARRHADRPDGRRAGVTPMTLRRNELDVLTAASGRWSSRVPAAAAGPGYVCDPDRRAADAARALRFAINADPKHLPTAVLVQIQRRWPLNSRCPAKHPILQGHPSGRRR